LKVGQTLLTLPTNNGHIHNIDKRDLQGRRTQILGILG